MTDYTIPRANAPIAGTEPPSTQWYNFIRYLDTRSSSAADDVQAEITVIAEKLGSPDGTVDNIPPLGNVTSVQGKQSIASSGIGVVQLRLVNDADTPDAVSFYGTDSAGVKGWNLLYDAFADTDNIFKINTDGIVSFDLTDLADSGTGALLATTFDAKGRKTGTKAATITGTAGRVTVANGDAVAGLPTIDLATLSDGGGGALLRIVRDAWGRLSGTSAATTSDLAEGSNLYFTTTRVLATLLAGLSTATSAAITAADSVLSALGKLQAQITALTSSLTGYVPTTRTISTTAPLTGGGDLSANRTLAIPAATTSVDGYLTGADWTTFNGKVATSRTITAGVGLSGGGDLSANRTVSMGTPSTLTGATTNSATGTTHTHALTLTKSDVGLGNVDNTSDVNKPVSTAQAAANALKFDKTGGTLTGSLNMSGVGANGQVFFSGTPGGGNEGYVYTDSSNGLRFFFIIEATDKVVLCNRAANGVIHLRANNATVGGAGESTVAIVNTLGLLAGSDNTKTLGGSANRWSVVYAATGSINTSDAREKTDVATLTADELAAAADLARAPGTYQWLSAVQAKGANARKHVGLTVQRAIEIMQSHGLDPMSYGFICYDTWAESPEIVDRETGELTQQYQAAGDRYSFRHDELLLFITRGFAARLDALEAA